ncbi:MAG: 4-hydroxy-tetrahydrodipicolinate synthase [Clostridiales bacterium]
MDFGNVITAMVTPFTADGQVDYNQAQQLAEYLFNHGSDSLAIAGTTGESPTLTNEEKLKLFAAVKETAKGKGKVIAGTTNNATASSVELTKKAEAIGVDGILAVVPYYNKPTQEGVYRHFAAIANNTSLPVILYNIPGRCVINMTPETIVRLSKIDNIVANKEASGSMDQVSEIRARTADDFLIYSGDDALTLPILSLGGRGIVSVAAHLVGNQIQDMIKAFQAGDNKKALSIHTHLLPLFKKIFIVANPLPIKYCVDKIIMPMGGCRLPLYGPEAKEKTILDEMLQEYNLL